MPRWCTHVAGDEILVDHAGEGKHGEARVLDLCEGIPLALGGVVDLHSANTTSLDMT